MSRNHQAGVPTRSAQRVNAAGRPSVRWALREVKSGTHVHETLILDASTRKQDRLPSHGFRLEEPLLKGGAPLVLFTSSIAASCVATLRPWAGSAHRGPSSMRR